MSFDCETELFGYGSMAPRVVCYSFAWWDGAKIHTAVFDKYEGCYELSELLARAIRGEIVIAGQNVSYDFLVHLRRRPEDWPLVVDAYEAGAIHCTMLGEQLLDIAQGLLRMQWDPEKEEYKANKQYSLEALSRTYLGWQEYKKDSYRLRYGELVDVPIADWPAEAVEYPKKDANATLRIAELQRMRAREIYPHDPLRADLAAKCRTYLALGLVSAWGLELDPVAARVFKERLEKACEELANLEHDDGRTLVTAGLLYRHVRGAKKGQLSRKDGPLRALVEADCAARGVPPAMTDGGAEGLSTKVKANAEALADCEAPLLRTMHDYLECSKLQSFAEKAVALGRGPFHPRYGLADTGRTTCSGGAKRKGAMLAFNVQALPRSTPKYLAGAPGLRECIVPRPGKVFSSTDYGSLEMVTWAQAQEYLFPGCENPLKDALNTGLDPHLMVAAQITKQTYAAAVDAHKAKDPEIKKWRQYSKVCNFGFPGGMGHKKFVSFAKSQGVVVDEATALMLKENFKSTWHPERYFAHVGELVRGGGATVVQLVSDRPRGGVGYTDACNGYFQGLAADLATDALWRVVVECYDERKKSQLLGSRVVAMIHDELICEHAEETAPEAAARVGEIMRVAAADWCPDVAIKAEPALMRRWSKEAGDAVKAADGRLICWEDRAQ